MSQSPQFIELTLGFEKRLVAVDSIKHIESRTRDGYSDCAAVESKYGSVPFYPKEKYSEIVAKLIGASSPWANTDRFSDLAQ